MATASRGLRRLTGIAMLTGACLGHSARTQDTPNVDQEATPFTTPIELRYGGFKKFSYTFRTDIVTPDGIRYIAEGWVMDGSVRPQGESLEWSYRLSNIGRDGKLRERGSLRVRTDPWGKVQVAHVLVDRWPPGGRARSLADSYFNESDLNFPLCSCPREPIRLNDTITLPVWAVTMPQPTLGSGNPLPSDVTSAVDTRRSVAVGEVQMENRRYLVVRHTGEVIATLGEGKPKVQTAGSTYIDTRTCLPRRSVWANRAELEGVNPPPLIMLHQNEARY